MIDRFLKSASILDLGYLLAEVPVQIEGYFFCTSCQRSHSEQVQHAPAGYAVSTMSWRCSRCGIERSRWTLIGAVRNRASARARLLDLLAEEVPRG